MRSLVHNWPHAFVPDAPFTYLIDGMEGIYITPLHVYRTTKDAFHFKTMIVRNRHDDLLYMLEEGNVFLTPDDQELILLHRYCRIDIRGFFALSDFDPLSPEKQAHYLANPFPVWRKKS